VIGFGRAVREKLKEAGWLFHHHGKGDHDVWHNPVTAGLFSITPAQLAAAAKAFSNYSGAPYPLAA
jgi:hypothetical protein